MSVKLTFVFGLLLASGHTQEQTVKSENVSELENNSELKKVLEPVIEASVEAKAEIKLDNLKIDDGNLNKKDDENVEKNKSGVKASASAAASLNFNFEEFLAKLFEAVQQNEKINKEQSYSEDVENNEEVKNNLPNEENPEEDVKSPFNYYFNVHATSSASA